MPTAEIRDLPSTPAPLPPEPPSELEEQPPRGHSRKRLIVAGLAAAAIAAALIWKFAETGETPLFQLSRLERGAIEATVSATGACNAVVSVQVGSQVSGNIKALYADFNTRVHAGQLVALIDPDMFQAKVTQSEAAWRYAVSALENARAAARKADADLSSAKATEVSQVAAIAKAKVAVLDGKAKLVRRQTMLAEQILSQEDLDTAQATYDQAVAEQQAAEAQRDAALQNVRAAEAGAQASQKQIAMFQEQVDLSQAALAQARIDLEHTRILAPVDGTVVARRMDVGQTVAASFQAPTIFEIAQDLTKMQVDTNVAESDVGHLNVGQASTFTVDAYPGEVFHGRVIQIRKAPISVQNVITYDAVIEVANPDFKLFPGMTANVSILIQRAGQVLRLPNSALRFRPAASLVAGAPGVKPQGPNWAIVYRPAAGAKLQPVAVKLGITDGNFTEIKEGTLTEGQQVAVGMSARASNPASAAPPAIPRRI